MSQGLLPRHLALSLCPSDHEPRSGCRSCHGGTGCCHASRPRRGGVPGWGVPAGGVRSQGSRPEASGLHSQGTKVQGVGQALAWGSKPVSREAGPASCASRLLQTPRALHSPWLWRRSSRGCALTSNSIQSGATMPSKAVGRAHSCQLFQSLSEEAGLRAGPGAVLF